MLQWLGYAESVLANTTSKSLSVHEIMDGILSTGLLQLSTQTSYSSLAAALFSEIQRPGSKIERTGNKFHLKTDNATEPVPSNISADSQDIGLCMRRSRRGSAGRLVSPVSTTPLLDVPTPQLTSTTTRTRSRSNTQTSTLPTISNNSEDSLVMENYSRRLRRSAHIQSSLSRPESPSVDQSSNENKDTSASKSKSVRFALEKNEVVFVDRVSDIINNEELESLPFPNQANMSSSIQV